jgi:hypothetical protein
MTTDHSVVQTNTPATSPAKSQKPRMDFRALSVDAPIGTLNKKDDSYRNIISDEREEAEDRSDAVDSELVLNELAQSDGEVSALTPDERHGDGQRERQYVQEHYQRKDRERDQMDHIGQSEHVLSDDVHVDYKPHRLHHKCQHDAEER